MGEMLRHVARHRRQTFDKTKEFVTLQMKIRIINEVGKR